MEKCESLDLGWPEKVFTGLRSWVTDWPVWWSELSAWQKVVPAAAIAFYWLALNALHGLRSDHIALGGLILIFSYGGRIGHVLRAFGMPFLLTGIIYDSQRFYADFLRGPVHVTEPYSFDKTFFGIHTAQGVLTPNEFWQLHTYPILDLITGFAYLVFFALFILISAYFYFVVSRSGTAEMSPARVREKSTRMIWSFLWLNLLGYTTYYWYAASPPWYVAMYGLGPARLDVPANQAGCLRFDHMLGTHFFSEMYGRAADVHGAIPSLHVSYPLLAAVFAFQFKRLRPFCFAFYLLMCFSAVYLNHHYILDILWGSTYTLLVAWAVDALGEWRKRARQAQPVPAIQTAT
jgi:membrane-associated phospholipid phosphatase